MVAEKEREVWVGYVFLSRARNTGEKRRGGVKKNILQNENIKKVVMWHHILVYLTLFLFCLSLATLTF